MMLTSRWIWFFSLIFVFATGICDQKTQNYDFHCTSATPASSFSSHSQCINVSSSCQAFIVYRAQEGYNALSSIAALFNSRTDALKAYNNLSKIDSDLPPDGYEIIIPTTCRCSEECHFCRAVYAYNASHSDSIPSIACGTFEGLVTAGNLEDFNPDFPGDKQTVSSISVPLKCSCPNSSDVENGIAYLVTYPITENDSTDLIGLKFKVSEEAIYDANGLKQFDAIFPQTTLFIPLTKRPYLSPDLVRSPPARNSETQILIPSESNTESKGKKYFLIFGPIVTSVIFFMVALYAATIFLWNKNLHGIVRSLSAVAPWPSNFSQEFLDDMTKLKHSFTYFSLEELVAATGNFNEGSLIGPGVYRGKFGNSDVAIKQISSREVANNIICLLTRINHLNVVKLEGYYDGTSPYLVFELAGNGCLKDCLSSPRLAKQLTWRRRIQIAYDLAEGLHYLHYCTKPAYVHQNINSRNVLITADWRAKISGFGSAMPLNDHEEKVDNSRDSSNTEGYLAPEYLKYKQASAKLDVYAFGVVLLELISAKEATENGCLLNNFLNSAAKMELHQDPSGFLDSLEQLMDPSLDRDYPVDHVLFLACIAKCCMEENPLKRVTISYVLMALSKIL